MDRPEPSPAQLAHRREVIATRRLLGRHVLVMDVEFQGSRILEVGYVRLASGWIADWDCFLVDPGPDVRVVGITTRRRPGLTDNVHGAGSFRDHASKVIQAAEGCEVFVGWNPTNDHRLIHDEFLRAGLTHGPMLWVDVAALYRAATGVATAPTLREACEHFDIGGYEWHNALEDARATARLLGRLCAELVERGVTREDVPVVGGWLGTEWPDLATLPTDVAARRRGVLPERPALPASVQRKWDRWQQLQGVTSRKRDANP